MLRTQQLVFSCLLTFSNTGGDDEACLTVARRVTDIFYLAREVCGVHISDVWPYRQIKDIKQRHFLDAASRPQSNANVIQLSSNTNAADAAIEVERREDAVSSIEHVNSHGRQATGSSAARAHKSRHPGDLFPSLPSCSLPPSLARPPLPLPLSNARTHKRRGLGYFRRRRLFR